jgi:peptide/nickel transport system substrate-binding protein
LKAPRTRRRRSLRTALLLAPAALLAAAACGEPPAAEGPEAAAGPVGGGTAVVAVGTDITGINPLLDGAGAFKESILDALFLQLFEEQPDFTRGPPSFLPELAASWQWSDSGGTLTIELRPGVSWSDGGPVTADDVVWTWRLQTDERLGWAYSQLKESILDIEAVDARRLQVRFTSPSMTRLAELNQGHILPRHRWQELPADSWRDNAGWFRENQVVSGPFRLADWQPAQQIVLERNPSYFRQGRPRLDRVVFRIVPETNSRLSQLLTGAADFVPQVPAAAAERIERSPDTRLESFWARQYNFIHWNLARPMLAETAARQALTLAIDRQRIVDTLWFGHARVASSPIISTVWAHRATSGPWPHDPDRAARLLAELGWRDGDGDGVLERNGRRFTLELVTNADNRLRTDAALMIQEDLRGVGVETRVRQLEFTTMVARLRERDFDAVLSAFAIDTSLDLTYAFHSGSIGDGFNFGGYSNPEVDRLIEAARASRDAAEQGALLGEIQGILHQEQPMTLLWEPQQLNGVSRRLRGVRPNPLGAFHRLEDWWLTPAV